MPRIGPIRRKDFLFYLRQMGFEGPYAGGKHQIMHRVPKRFVVRTSTGPTSAPGFLARILRDSGIDRVEWEKL